MQKASPCRQRSGVGGQEVGGKGSLEKLPVKFCFFKHLPDKKNKNQNELQAIVSLVHSKVSWLYLDTQGRDQFELRW